MAARRNSDYKRFSGKSLIVFSLSFVLTKLSLNADSSVTALFVSITAILVDVRTGVLISP